MPNRRQGRDGVDAFTIWKPVSGKTYLELVQGRDFADLDVRLACSDGVFFFSQPLRPFFFAIIFRLSLAGWQDRPGAPGGSENQDSETEELVK